LKTRRVSPPGFQRGWITRRGDQGSRPKPLPLDGNRLGLGGPPSVQTTTQKIEHRNAGLTQGTQTPNLVWSNGNESQRKQRETPEGNVESWDRLKGNCEPRKGAFSRPNGTERRNSRAHFEGGPLDRKKNNIRTHENPGRGKKQATFTLGGLGLKGGHMGYVQQGSWGGGYTKNWACPDKLFGFGWKSGSLSNLKRVLSANPSD